MTHPASLGTNSSQSCPFSSLNKPRTLSLSAELTSFYLCVDVFPPLCSSLHLRIFKHSHPQLQPTGKIYSNYTTHHASKYGLYQCKVGVEQKSDFICHCQTGRSRSLVERCETAAAQTV